MHLTRIVEKLEAGDRVVVTFPDPTKKTLTPEYSLVSHGWRLTPTQYRKLTPRLIPEADGLFDISQTYRLGPPLAVEKKPRRRATA